MSLTKSTSATNAAKTSSLSSVKENFQYATENPLKLNIKTLDTALKAEDLFGSFKMPNLSTMPMSLKNVLPSQSLGGCQQFNINQIQNQNQILNNFSQLQSLGLGQNLNMLQQLHNISLLENLQKIPQASMNVKPQINNLSSLMMGKSLMSKEEQMYNLLLGSARGLEAQKLLMGNPHPLQEFVAKPNLWSN